MCIKEGTALQEKNEELFSQRRHLWLKKPLNDKLAKAGRINGTDHHMLLLLETWCWAKWLLAWPPWLFQTLSLPDPFICPAASIRPLHPPIQLQSQLSFREYCSLPPLLSSSVFFILPLLWLPVDLFFCFPSCSYPAFPWLWLEGCQLTLLHKLFPSCQPAATFRRSPEEH